MALASFIASPLVSSHSREHENALHRVSGPISRLCLPCVPKNRRHASLPPQTPTPWSPPPPPPAPGPPPALSTASPCSPKQAAMIYGWVVGTAPPAECLACCHLITSPSSWPDALAVRLPQVSCPRAGVSRDWNGELSSPVLLPVPSDAPGCWPARSSRGHPTAP